MANEQLIWEKLMREIQNPYGVAGLMGNLFAESSLDPLCKTGGNEDVKGMSNVFYATSVDDGFLSGKAFANDGAAFGLAQWCYWSRKEALYNYAQEHGSIGSVDIQLDFMLQELKTYKTVWNTLLSATSVKEASDMVMVRYEKPSNQSDKAKEKRATFGQEYYLMFSVLNEESPKKLYVMITKPNVNLRVGNAKSYPMAGKAIMVGSKYEWVATADNNWHAIVAKSGKQVMWIDGSCCKIVEE